MYSFKRNNPAIYFQSLVIQEFEFLTIKLEELLEELKNKNYITNPEITTVMANGGYAIYIKFLFTRSTRRVPNTVKMIESLKNTIYLYPGPYFAHSLTNDDTKINPVLLAKYGDEQEYSIPVKGVNSIKKAISKFFQSLEDYNNQFTNLKKLKL